MTPEPAERDHPRVGGSLLTEPILVVQRPVAPVEDAEYVIYDRCARRLAAVRRVLRQLHVVGADSGVQLVLTVVADPPGQVVVTGRAGHEVGRIVREDVFGRVRFILRVGGRQRGSIHGDDLRGWNYAVLDDAGNEIARITRTWEGLAEAMRTTAHDHVLQFRRPVRDPLRTLVVAGALAVETACESASGAGPSSFGR
jgi:hypothetical protein